MHTQAMSHCMHVHMRAHVGFPSQGQALFLKVGCPDMGRIREILSFALAFSRLEIPAQPHHVHAYACIS